MVTQFVKNRFKFFFSRRGGQTVTFFELCNIYKSLV
jgi:hypothetical protein